MGMVIARKQRAPLFFNFPRETLVSHCMLDTNHIYLDYVMNKLHTYMYVHVHVHLLNSSELIWIYYVIIVIYELEQIHSVVYLEFVAN